MKTQSWKSAAFGCFLLLTLSSFDFAAQLNPLGTQPSPAADDEKADLNRAAQEAANAGPNDFIRAFEKFLKKHPHAEMKDRAISALFKASKDLKDDRRIVLYGQQLLAKDPNDISVLPFVGLSLNSFNDPKSSAIALELGQRLEKRLVSSDAPKDGETPREKGRRTYDLSKHVSGAVLIQANALGITGQIPQAIALAQKAFDEVPSTDAARSLGRWQAQSGKYEAAVLSYANAFAISDSQENHVDDRSRLAEFYRKTHKDESGLGDIVLAAYDKMTALNEQRQKQFGNTLSTKPINFELTSLQGGRLPLLSLKGKVIVMDFWATTCGPCRIQHPLFEQVKKSFKEDSRVVFLEVDNEETKDIVKAFIQQQNWDSNIYFDDGLSQVLGLQGIPTTVLFDRKGDVYSKVLGFQPESFISVLTSKIQDALAPPADLPSPAQVN